MKSLPLIMLLAACDTAYVSSGPAPMPIDPCGSLTYHSSACDSGYDWNPGYYGSTHVWVRPHYIRRIVVAPIYHTTTVIRTPAPMTITRTPLSRPTVTRTNITRPMSTVTRTTVTRRRVR